MRKLLLKKKVVLNVLAVDIAVAKKKRFLMTDVKGVTIQIGDSIFYTSHDDGKYRKAVVTGFTTTMVRINDEWNRPGKKSPQYIIVNN